MIESIVVGQHVDFLPDRQGGISGTFQIKKNETLRLEARFDEGKLVLFKQPPKVELVKAEVEKRSRGRETGETETTARGTEKSLNRQAPRKSGAGRT